ncbi:hypothetical protein [Flagellimonas allohymeniacidonis]|uniref:Secreted protein n=1 Tax=Flagellimonas allohymeniacidonis TaxID=2517819 RepID=A0A4Q8QE90_9FLAO|nr:hypothetical protein [Allomuricauda hymeniacidonis]TAI48812.1 hypothetical protein EW142_03165 [Allomuricauda hymeniacidonis]
MRLNPKTIVFPAFLAFGMLFSTNAVAQTSFCTDKKEAKASCAMDEEGKKASCGTSSKAMAESTSGCSPSGCRGAKTKFGEAKVISNLRLDLIAVKAEMEKSKSPVFESRVYDIHGIVGETDDESLQIIVRELKIMEEAFAEKLRYTALAFNLPKNKAKQVSYLKGRIEGLKEVLSTQ